MEQNSIRGLCDLHTHTNFSPDAKSAPEEMCERAIELGLAKYAITDHCDVNFWERAEGDGVRDFDMYGSGEYAPASIAVLPIRECPATPIWWRSMKGRVSRRSRTRQSPQAQAGIERRCSPRTFLSKIL